MSTRASSSAVYLAFFLSGSASLICEVVWFKLFGLAVGNTTQSASAVVTVFFIGLGLGSLAVGRFADRIARPLRAYALLEIALCVISAATTAALASWSTWIRWFTPLMGFDAASALPIKLGLALALLIVPTMLMGSTLPVLARWLVRQRHELGSRVGVLYALNTLGAALGCLWVGFYGVGRLGVFASGMSASAVYLAVGLGALWLSRTEARSGAASTDDDTVAAPIPADVRWWVAAFAFSGFVSVSYEILWFRLLAIATVNTVYVFASLLAVYLLGLVVGAAAVARWLRRPRGDLQRVFVRLQLGIALSGVVTLAALGRAKTFLAWTGTSVLEVDGTLAVMGIALVILLPPCTLIGMTLPVAAELTVQGLASVGSRVGLIYGANTIVGAMGSLATGFLLIPQLGTQGTAVALAVANVVLAAALASRSDELRRDRELMRESVLLVAGLALLFGWLGPTYLVDSQTRIVGAEILDVRETTDGTFVMVEYDEAGTRYQQVIVNGTSYANNRPPGRHYMSLLAHLPILLHDDPRQVVVICIGTGTTVGSASIQDRVTQVSAVDLSREIFDLAPGFVPWNHSFHESDRVRNIVADGRHFLLVSEDRFDVLTFEPPPPIEAGVANLYTVEFYDLARERARPGAIVAQWIPFHQGFQELQRQLVRSAMASFPHVSLWLADNQEGILLASDRPLALDPAAIARRMAEDDVAADLGSVGIDGVEDLLALFVLSGDDLVAWVGPGPAVTDDRPTVERFLGHPPDPFSTPDLLAHRTPLSKALVAPMPDLARMRRSQEVARQMWLAVDARVAGDLDATIRHTRQALDLEPHDPYLIYRLREHQDQAARRSRP